MPIRYFKATDGKITVFRASARDYASAWFTSADGERGAYLRGEMGFSSKSSGQYAAVEIDKAEYDALQAAKLRRVIASGDNPKWATSPSPSWVRNADVSA